MDESQAAALLQELGEFRKDVHELINAVLVVAGQLYIGNLKRYGGVDDHADLKMMQAIMDDLRQAP